MNTSIKTRIRFVLHCLTLALMVSLLSISAQAIPYASGVTESGGQVTFVLNEAADNVRVVFTGPASTNNLGPKAKGPHTFNRGGAASYRIEVSTSTPLGWTRISDDTNRFNSYYSPGGIAVNKNPANLALFGRVYVSTQRHGTNSTVGTYTPFRITEEGIYVLNADLSDALGQGDSAKTAGITFTGGTAGEGLRSPWKIEVGQDNNLYIADFSTNTGTIYRADPDVNTGETVLEGIGSTVNTSVHTSCNGSPIAKGSIAGGDLQIWAIDGQWAGTGGRNRLLRWDISSGPLPHNAAPSAILGTAGLSGNSDIQSDLDIAPDGKFFLCQNRAIGTAGVYDSGRVNIRVYDTDGTTLLWDSLAQSLVVNPSGTDIFANARAIAVSPDNKMVAITINSAKTWIVGLTNGVPDITTRTLVNTDAGFTATTSAAIQREVAFDAAGNLYVGNNSHEVIRVWSPGGTKTATTVSDGTFIVESPLAEVNITAADNSASESGDTGHFTVTRTGDTSNPLTVSYTMSGTASNGTDFTTLSGSITFAAGASTTNIMVNAINDSVAEFTETVIATLAGSPNYILINPTTAMVSIIDNETPELSITAVLTGVAESGSHNPFQITRRGDLSVDLSSVNLTYSGTASGGDYSAPSAVSIAPDVVNQLVTIDVTDDGDNEPNETIIANLAVGSGYTIGNPNSASTSILNDDAPLPPGVLFAADFELDVSTQWNINKSGNTNGNIADFSFDYSSVGIPPAPNSGGTTRGLKLQANLTGGVFGGLSVSPKNQFLSGDYILSFDMWLNYHGPLDVGGSGSTQVTGAGIGTAGTTAQWAGGTQDSVHFGVTGDGGSSVDYRAYSTAATTGYVPASGVFTAGVNAGPTPPDSRNNTDPYYAGFGGESAPAAQLALYPGQTSATSSGAVGMAWRSVVIAVTNNVAHYSIDGLSIATVDLNTVTVGGGSILLNHYDINAASSTDTNRFALHFGLFDNVRVTIPAPPAIEMTSIEIQGGNVVINFTADSNDTTSSFTLETSANVAAGYTTDNNAQFSGGSGTFSVTTPISGTTHFYQIKRVP